MAPSSSSVTVTSRFHESVTRNAFRSYLAEFISTFFYVLLVIGSGMSSRKLMPDASSLNPTSVVVGGIANAFALSSVLYIAWDISGGHVNPAVTFAIAVGGHISVPTALFYWVAQLIASLMACLVLKVVVVGMVPTYTIAEEMTGFGASILEGLLTFVLVYTVYAARDPRRGPLGSMGPLVIGLMAGAGALAASPFSGGSMNPACAFGSAAIGGSFRNQAVYWVGPLIGAAVAGLLYDNAVFPPSPSPQPSDSIRDGVVGV